MALQVIEMKEGWTCRGSIFMVISSCSEEDISTRKVINDQERLSKKSKIISSSLNLNKQPYQYLHRPLLLLWNRRLETWQFFFWRPKWSFKHIWYICSHEKTKTKKGDNFLPLSVFSISCLRKILQPSWLGWEICIKNAKLLTLKAQGQGYHIALHCIGNFSFFNIWPSKIG